MSQANAENRVVIVAILTIQNGSIRLFREYETNAARIMERHRGAIERTVLEEPSDPQRPLREAHVITFPDLAAFDGYRSDPELLSLAHMRASCIANTQLLFGREGPDYMAISRAARG
jgi:hypothetical protein